MAMVWEASGAFGVCIPTVAPWQHSRLASAIFGHRAGPAVLESVCYSSLFFLHRRIFPIMGEVARARGPPSVPPARCMDSIVVFLRSFLGCHCVKISYHVVISIICLRNCTPTVQVMKDSISSKTFSFY
jgi:hypothetical protein